MLSTSVDQLRSSIETMAVGSGCGLCETDLVMECLKWDENGGKTTTGITVEGKKCYVLDY